MSGATLDPSAAHFHGACLDFGINLSAHGEASSAVPWARKEKEPACLAVFQGQGKLDHSDDSGRRGGLKDVVHINSIDNKDRADLK